MVPRLDHLRAELIPSGGNHSFRAPAAVLLLLAAGCGPAPPEPEPAVAAAPLAEPLFPSPEDAAEAFLSALEAGDPETLRSLALTEREFAEAVYPLLPASRPERNTSAEFLWGLSEPRSRNSLAGALSRHGGTRLELVAVDFLGETTDYGAFRVHRETVLTVRTPGGDRRVIRLFGSMIEQDRRYKLYSFVVD